MITTDQLADFIKNRYAIQPNHLEPLPGEMDKNYKLTDAVGSSFVVKIAHPSRTFAQLEMENAIMEQLQQNVPELTHPTPVPNREGTTITPLDGADHSRLWVRILTWVEGRVMAKVNPHSEEFLESLGRACAKICSGLKGFTHPAAHRNLKWDSTKADWIEAHLPIFSEPKKRDIVHYFLQLFQQQVKPALPELQKSVNHNDPNNYNVLVSYNLKTPEVIGILDFGDAIYNPTVNDLAIACAYAMLDKTAPLEAAKPILKGFHTVLPLHPKDCEVLFPLIATRLIISVTVATLNEKQNPDNEYLQISQAPVWRLLHQLRQIAPAFAHYSFRAVCGYEPCPKHLDFLSFVTKNAGTFHSIINKDLMTTPCKVLDLSIGSLSLGNNTNFENSKRFEEWVEEQMRTHQVEICIGKYNECRPVYTSDGFTEHQNNGPNWRTLHIGLDIFKNAGTRVYAPLAGKVHSFANNQADRDYGPTIILEHRVSEKLTFYTLYGHLSKESLDGKYTGMPISAGEAFATFGSRAVNGNWPPHLHFQIMLDMLDKKGDFPGVVFASQQKLWTSICPNPNWLTGISLPVEGKMPSSQPLLEQRQKHLGPNLSLSYQNPLHIRRGFLTYLYDHQGRRYLDTVNNVAHVGHQHPKVVAVAQQQLAVFNSNTRYLHKNLMEYAAQLCATLPKPLSVCYLVNSGSEANELALRLARTYTGREDFLVIDVGYHGNTQGCIDISPYKFNSRGGKGCPPNTHVLTMPDVFRGPIKNTKNAGEQYGQEAQQLIEKNWSEGRDIAGFIGESILSCGGQIVLPENYLKTVYLHVRKAGGVCIADEVQTGFGRVGSHFWGFELQGVVPDIVTLGKPVGNGHPMGVVITTPEIAAAFNNGMEYFNTFGGNPVSSAIGKAVLDVIQTENLQQNALQVGNYLKQQLQTLSDTYPIIADVRGEGLFLGFELVKNTRTIEPAAQEATYLANRMRNMGVLMSTDGKYHNVMKIKPPIIFGKKHADFFIEMLNKVLKEDFMQTK